MTKLNRLSLLNFRGAKNKIDLQLDKSRSLLLYGDNGTGKSSFADAVEWFFLDKISHLAGEEVGGTHEGVKNALATDTDECFVEIEFDSHGIQKKSLVNEKGRLKSESTKQNENDLPNYSTIERDHILLRNVELVRFILATKTNRLDEISKIIGFDAVTQTKAHLKKSLSDIKSVIKAKGFEASVTKEKSLAAQQLGELVNTHEQFFSACNTLVTPLKLEFEIKNLSDLEKVEKLLKEGVDPKATERLQAYNSIVANQESYLKDFQNLTKQWEVFWNKRNSILKDQERLKKISISKLLDEASSILSTHEKDDCPLCLQVISRETLIANITTRITELKEIIAEIDQMESDKKNICANLAMVLGKLDTFVKDAGQSEKKDSVNELLEFIKEVKIFSSSLSSSTIHTTPVFPDGKSIEEIKALFSVIASDAEEKAKELSAYLKNPKVEIATKLAIAKTAFGRLIDLQKESEILTKHQSTLEKIVSDFNLKQKLGMEAFLNAISHDMNELYSFMNSNVKIEGIKLICLTDDKSGEFNGVAVSLKFHGQEIQAPKKYLSESNLNCLGLCLFLSSVKNFNKSAKFFILDDVISSFDKNHRLRFGQLLLEKFNDYQVILLTHETEWFEYLSSQVKGLGWLIQRTQWTSDLGTSLKEPVTGLKELVQKHINENDEHVLGNSLRRFVEYLLKDLCLSLEAPLAFRLNDKNESRTLDELFSAFRGRLNNKSKETADKDEVKRLTTCQFITNKGSHDSGYNSNFSDMKTVFDDIIEFEKTFKCVKCNNYVSTKFPVIGQSKISCRCGQLLITWN